MGRIVIGIILGVVLVPVAVMGWFRFGHPPVAVGDAPFPMEKQITSVPLHARINSELAKTVPIPADGGALVSGAEVYRNQCAACHGYHGKPSPFAAHMFPKAPPLWEKHGNAVGVSDDPPAETYWKIANGIRLTGMPAYKNVLTDMEMWQVSLLLSNADKPLPPGALEILRGQTPGIPAAGAEAAKP